MNMIAMIIFPFLFSPISYYIGRKHKAAGQYLTVAVLAAELAQAVILTCSTGSLLILPGVCGLGLSFSATGLQVWLCILAGFLWLISGLFSLGYLKEDAKNHRYDMFLMLTEGAILGVFLSADLFTTLVFFEMMSFASYPLVIHRETKDALRAGASYLSYAVIGGMASLMGLFLLYQMLGTLSFSELTKAVAGYTGSPVQLYVAGAFALVTFAAKVCMFPLHTWLPGSYAEAPSPATALLSGIITKAGIFGIFGLTAKLFLWDTGWGNMLLVFGLATALVGGILALFHTNLKKTIAYSSMSQIGFILVGTAMTALCGEENGLAVWGSILHLTNHSLIKLILLLTAGVIVYHVGGLDYNVIRGFGRKKPALAFAFAVPALGVMSVPCFNGYISKTLIHEAMVEYIEHLEEHGASAGYYHAAEWLFLIAGGLTVGYMLKLFFCIFIEKNEDARRQEEYDALNGRYMSKLWLILLDGCALIIPVLGLLPHRTMDVIARYTESFLGHGPEEEIHYFSLTNLKGSAVSLVIGVLLYLLVVRILVRTKEGYKNRISPELSLEEKLYVPVIFKILPFVGAFAARFLGSLFEWFICLCNKVLFVKYNRIVTPPEDHYFARYAAEDPGVRGIRGQMAYGLLLFGIGFVVILAFLLGINFG